VKLPTIDYKFWLSDWSKSIGEQKTYTNKNMIKYIIFDGNINSCTNEIFSIIKSDKIDNSSILRVIDLIYSWGGKSGRMFYASSRGQLSPREDLEVNKEALIKYMKGIELAMSGNPDSINYFCQINGIGKSYASKHAYFWSLNSSNPLIIVDSKIAGSLGYQTINSLQNNFSYESIIASFKSKAFDEFADGNPSNVERALFAFHNHYFLNDNSGWKNNIENHDYDEALRLAKTLF